MDKEIIILGAGISGLGASYALREKGMTPLILEKDNTYGGLCGNFVINNFRFDRFVHFSFAKDEKVLQIFNSSIQDINRHIPNPYNFYNRRWIKHPAQNNLYPLPDWEKEKIVDDFKGRPNPENYIINNYENWLRIQYGDYFAEHFPMVYTRKYWMREAKDLETGWIGNRLYQPSIDEVIKGCQTSETPITYYTKEMRYPAKGGYKSFLTELVKEGDIKYNAKVYLVDSVNRMVKTTDGGFYSYEYLISSLPLPEVVGMLSNVPDEIQKAASELQCTSGYMVSVGLKTENIPPYLWWYIYDEDILAARVYSPSLKSKDNVPKGCSSIQMEIYCSEAEYSREELYNRSVKKMIDLNIIKESDILFYDIRFELYANVIFDHNIYVARHKVREYLESVGIYTIGRFGEWGYLWSDQSLLSGLKIAERICE